MMKFNFGSRYGQDGNPNGVGSKLEKLRQHLKELARRSKPGATQVGGGPATANETITDDGGIPANKAESILHDEALVRDALALFGVDYNGLIAMQTADGSPSVYAQAVQANPALNAEVAGAAQPVVAALKVAMGFKPVADFTAKYGTTPEDIKAAIKAEMEAEAKGGENAVPVRKQAAAPVFSTQGGARSVAAPTKKAAGLKDVFGR
ncbi:MAG: hypothetical protein GC129_02540 [Proteobacteria bacterium]|nr:hypothetical protein [Pseudomonadota bacterium]